jgi:hypothetical protein
MEFGDHDDHQYPWTSGICSPAKDGAAVHSSRRTTEELESQQKLKVNEQKAHVENHPPPMAPRRLGRVDKVVQSTDKGPKVQGKFHITCQVEENDQKRSKYEFPTEN